LNPPQVIADMLLAKPTPMVSINNKGTWMLLMEYEGYPSVEELARPELRLAGLRINPMNLTPSRQRYLTELTLRNIRSGETMEIVGLPQPLAASNVSWSPDETRIAFLQTTSTQV